VIFSKGSCGKPKFVSMKRDIQHYIYLGLLILFVIFLPTSKYMTSLVQLLLAIHFLLRGNLWARVVSGFRKPELLYFLLLFAVHVVGMIYTSDLNYGWHDLKIKLPLLGLPIILATSEKLSPTELKALLLLFVASVFTASIVSVTALVGWIQIPMNDFRSASIFISHIRFALLIDVSIFILTFYALRPGIRIRQKASLFAGALYFIAFLILSKAMTGLVIAVVLGIILTLRWFFSQTGRVAKWIAIIGLIAIPVFLSGYIGIKISDFYTEKDNLEIIDEYTSAGNLYWHDSSNLSIENGYKVGLYWCEKEMKSEWPKRSSIAYDAKDLKGHDIKYTLIRYLTSLGYRKDAEGISKLSDEDVKLIESGYANSIYRQKNRFHTRVYEIIWQFDEYYKGGTASGHSLTQRIEFLKTGLAIVQDHFFVGVGTGDVKQAFDQKYDELDSKLSQEWRLRAHNQWLSFFIAFGLLGFLIIVLAFFLPAILKRGFSQFLFLMFFAVAFISMFNEDTLETQAGVAFIAFFYPLFLYAIPDEKRIK